MPVRVHTTKNLKPLGSTKSDGKLISPTKELRALRDGEYFVVDDEKSRRHIINAAHRLNIKITTRKCATGYEVHRLEKPAALAVQDYVKLK